MKKIVCRLLCLCVVGALLVPVYAQGIQDQVVALSDEAHVYSVVPGTQAWDKLAPEERYEACSVSEVEVENMTTDALIETVINYPYLINIYAYDSLALGVEEVSKYFPGLKELFSREDATEALGEYIGAKVSTLSANEVDLNVFDAQTIMGFIAHENIQVASSLVYDTVSTPNGSDVDVIVDMSWDDYSMVTGFDTDFDIALAQSQELEDVYSSATLFRNPAPNYNCHSYAWYSTLSSNEYWMNDPSLYISDGSYESHTAAVGCIVTYRSNNVYTHSGRIVATPGGPVTVRSKWGALGVFTHDVDDCPYVGTGASVSVSSWDRA